jgi:hypothetical protein
MVIGEPQAMSLGYRADMLTFVVSGVSSTTAPDQSWLSSDCCSALMYSPPPLAR